jgi:tyrosyl-tRNA synthetase
LNTTDVDAEKYIKIFTFLDKESIDTLIEGHKEEASFKSITTQIS